MKKKGATYMETNFYINGKKNTKKALTEQLGKERLNRYIAEAKETFFEDPYIQNDFLTANGILTIEFC
jgi:hypothetical protein